MHITDIYFLINIDVDALRLLDPERQLQMNAGFIYDIGYFPKCGDYGVLLVIHGIPACRCQDRHERERQNADQTVLDRFFLLWAQIPEGKVDHDIPVSVILHGHTPPLYGGLLRAGTSVSYFWRKVKTSA